jgi:hypothetical protein
MEKISNKIQLETLKLLAKEYERLDKKYSKKRDKELEKMKAKFQGQNALTKDEIDDLYGYESITLEEHDRMLKILEKQDDQILDAESIPTSTKECLKILSRELSNIKDEIWELSPKEYKQKTREQAQENEKSLKNVKKQLGIE